jgi:Protein of unknown function (DUF2628)
MPAFAVFEPPARAGRVATDHTDRFVFLRERFGWAAFLFGPLWMIWRRLWLVLIMYLVVLGLIEFGLRRLGIDAQARFTVYFLVALLVGMEAATLRRWTLLRRGWRDRGIVVADDLEMAERRFFDSWSADRPMPPPPPPPPPQPPLYAPASNSGAGVIGLFPEPGGGR